MGNSIMFQGTASNVGKSLIVAAFCRIFHQDGLRVIPFKSQNMALNSYVTAEGLEISRAQVFQAEAAGLAPSVKMNPILLKPHTDNKSQVIINGKVYGDMDAKEYDAFKPQLLEMITKVYEEISSQSDVVVIEGAGSPAEINLKDKDIVNMEIAKIADAPVILIGDIDRGGVFASLVGTIMLLSKEERERIKGIIINKFRGDIKLLQPGIKMLEEMIHIPVLGVLPYMDVFMEDEDSLTPRFHEGAQERIGNKEVLIEVVCLPHISNFTDFTIFETQEDVRVRYITRGKRIGNPDMLIIPGTKNTMEDLLYLRESGLIEQIKTFAKTGKLVVGICGGYQMLGKKLYDPEGVEGSIHEMEGLGLLDIETRFESKKEMAQVRGRLHKDLPGYLKDVGGKEVAGYEIHMGTTILGRDAAVLLTIEERLGEKAGYIEGCTNKEGNVVGVYLHGLFDSVDFMRSLLNTLRKKKGLEEVHTDLTSLEAFKNNEYDKLAKIVRENVDIETIYKWIKTDKDT
jgi:adenosylcobyric acid synthase